MRMRMRQWRTVESVRTAKMATIAKHASCAGFMVQLEGRAEA